MSIFDASTAYQEEGTPLVILGGKEYGSGSSRDWAAKGTRLLGVKAVLVESFERIHRSNLVGMGVLPLQFVSGESAATYELDGTETFDIHGLAPLNQGQTVPLVPVTVTRTSGEQFTFTVRLRIDTPTEADYYRHGGVLNYVLRQLARS
jgi:aconitate hydratase